jgi:hypothetical protein
MSGAFVSPAQYLPKTGGSIGLTPRRCVCDATLVGTAFKEKNVQRLKSADQWKFDRQPRRLQDLAERACVVPIATVVAVFPGGRR